MESGIQLLIDEITRNIGGRGFGFGVDFQFNTRWWLSMFCFQSVSTFQSKSLILLTFHVLFPCFDSVRHAGSLGRERGRTSMSFSLSTHVDHCLTSLPLRAGRRTCVCTNDVSSYL
jgi:hypothetical protein